jgi:hypothetical protein
MPMSCPAAGVPKSNRSRNPATAGAGTPKCRPSGKQVGGRAIDASPGSYVYGPPDVPHTFVVTSPVARYLFITEPAGFDGFVRAVSTPADKLTLPPAIPEHQEDPNTLATIAAEFGIEIIGPPGIPA